MVDFFRRYYKENRLFYLFVLCVSLVYGLVFTMADFYETPIKELKDFSVVFLQWVVIVISTFGLIYLISINRYVFIFLFPVLTLLTAVIAFFRITAHVTITSSLIDASLNNDFRTSFDLVSVNLVLYLLLVVVGIIVAVRLRYKIKRFQLTYVVIHLVVSLAIIFMTNSIITPFIRPISERIPYVIFYSFGNYLNEKQIAQERRPSISNGATCKTDSLLVVVVIGESLRSDHLSLNGYSRNTTPRLKAKNVVSLPNVYSEYTYTNRSIPHLLTRADSIHPERAFNEPSFISIFNKCGYQTSWIANQNAEDTYIYFVKEAQKSIFVSAGKNDYNFDKWLDNDLLPSYRQSIKSNSSRSLIVVHSIGSHWWYNSHFSSKFERYRPILQSKVLSSCTNEEIINSYDNTVLYTDYFLSSLIDELSNKKAVFIYLSDHGESLGENGQWLHASDGEAINYPASFVWMSEKYILENQSKLDQLKKNRLKRWRTDYLFHSVLDAGDISSPYFNKQLSIFQ